MMRLFQTFSVFTLFSSTDPSFGFLSLGFWFFFVTFPLFPGWCEHCLKLCWSLKERKKIFWRFILVSVSPVSIWVRTVILAAPASPLWLIRFFPELFPWIKNDWLFCVLYHLPWGLVSQQIGFFALSSSCSQASLGGFFTTFIQCCLILCSLYCFFLLCL